MKNLIQIAVAEIGVTEIEGDIHNERILQYAKDIGFGSWYDNDEIPWCSVFLNWAAQQAGLQMSKDGRARSWADIGQPARIPEPGDIAMFSPSPGGTKITHVGIFMGYSQDHGRIYVLGGNQSNAVNITGFRTNMLVGFRRLGPADGQVLSAEEKVLKRGDKGADVIALQDSLKLAGFDVGTSDGDFGRMTESAVRALQQSTDELAETGVFDAETRVYLKKLLETMGAVSTR